MDREMIRYLLVGFVSAWIASITVRGHIMRLRGCLPFVLFGVTGSLAGGYLFHLLKLSPVAAVVAASVGAIGALVFLQVLRNA
jgi:uncharacterized membrane protein YeaQ/YmgE (transglycosylase-associated protein family)